MSAWKNDAHIVKGRFDQILSRRAAGCDWTRVDKKLLSMVSGDYFYEDFKGIPVVGLAATGAAATGTGGDENVVQIGNSVFMYHMLGTQTIVKPSRTALGLDIAHDLTDNDGVEYTNGIALADAKRVFTVATDKAFFFKVKFSIADVSGTDDCAVGFRKAEAFQANIDDYDEAACLNVISGDIKIESIINNAATTVTDTTDNWADGETHTLEVRVSLTGAVTYLIDGVAPTVTAAVSFDSGEVLVPFFYFLHATTSPGAIVLKEWEWGFLGQAA